jgi:hypothetical protein
VDTGDTLSVGSVALGERRGVWRHEAAQMVALSAAAVCLDLDTTLYRVIIIVGMFVSTRSPGVWSVTVSLHACDKQNGDSTPQNETIAKRIQRRCDWIA